MPTYFTSPVFQRQGVVAGFNLAAPDTSGTPGPGPGSPVVFQFYNNNVTISGTHIVIDIGYQHYINIGGTTYAYVQESPGGVRDSVATIVTNLANAINGAPDPFAIATANTSLGTVTLTPRLDTGAEIDCTASDGNSLFTPSQLIELTGNNLIPTITKGVLFAQGLMYAPSTAPILTAAPASQQSYLYYSSTSGWYWSASSTPTVSDDACVGWVVTNATEVIAVSSSKIGSGAEALVVPQGPILLGASESGDTDVPAQPTFAVGADDQGRLILANVGFPPGNSNVYGVTSLTWILFFVDLMATPPATLTAAMLAGDLSLSASAALPAASPTQPVFTFYNTTTGGVTIGPGYVHNIDIGGTEYGYVQQTGDTAAVIADNLAAVINAAADPRVTATAVGSTVILSPVQNNGAVIACTASDGNTAQNLTESFPSLVMIDQELIQVNATNGSSIVRGALGSTPAAHSNGATIYQIQSLTVNTALDGSLWSSGLWPTVIGMVPFTQKALEAVLMWATNEFGDSPTASFCYSQAATSSGFPGLISVAPPRSITAPGTISPSDVLVLTDMTGGSYTQPLPVSSTMRGPLTLKKPSSDGNTLTIAPASGETIDGGSSVTITTPGSSVTLMPMKSGGYRIIASGGTINVNSTTLSVTAGSDAQNPLTYNSSCGDGVTDATSAILSAIAAGGLNLPSGYTFLTSQVALSGLPDGFTIYGGGRLKLKSGVGAPLLTISGMNDIRIVDCRFDGNSATGTGNAVIALSGVSIASLNGLRVLGGQGAGISLATSTAVRIMDCHAAAQTPGLTADLSSTYQAFCNTGIGDREN